MNIKDELSYIHSRINLSIKVLDKVREELLALEGYVFKIKNLEDILSQKEKKEKM